MKALVFYGQTGRFTWRMGAAVLAAQSVLVFFGALVARAVHDSRGDANAGLYLVVGSALAVLALVAAAMMRRPIGVTLGWLIQAATLLSAVLVPEMLGVGLIFGGLWVVSLVQGHRLDALPRPTGDAEDQPPAAPR